MTRRQEIIACAKALFRDRGYQSVSMRDMAQQMNLKAASLYNHIASKEEILAEITLHLAHKFTDEMSMVKKIQADSVIKLEAVINHHVDITLKDPEAIAIVNNDWVHLKGKNFEEFVKLRDGYEQDLRAIISAGVESGELKTKSEEVILFAMLSTLRTLHSWYRKRSGVEGQQLKNDITEILLKGVTK